MNSFVVQITYVFKFVDFIILSSRLISQIIAKNDIISIVHPGNASKQWYIILGDPGADSGGEGKSKRAEKFPRPHYLFLGLRAWWYMCYGQKTENVTEDNQSHVNASRDSLARQFDCRLREWFLKVLSDTLQTSVYCLRVMFFISWWNINGKGREIQLTKLDLSAS